MCVVRVSARQVDGCVLVLGAGCMCECGASVRACARGRWLLECAKLLVDAKVRCMYACVRAGARVYTCVRACTHVYVRVHVYTCVYACVCACTRVYVTRGCYVGVV